MKKRKKNGFTMVELMVSIFITAIVMIFLVRVLLDVRYDSTNEIYNSANQINRAEIIKTIEQDLNNRVLKYVGYSGGVYTFYVDNCTTKATLAITGSNAKSGITFTYTPVSGTAKSWKMKYNNVESFVSDKNNVKFNMSYGYGSYILDIPVIVDKEHGKNDKILSKDSKLDDIFLVLRWYDSAKAGSEGIPANDPLNLGRVTSNSCRVA